MMCRVFVANDMSALKGRVPENGAFANANSILICWLSAHFGDDHRAALPPAPPPSRYAHPAHSAIELLRLLCLSLARSHLGRYQLIPSGRNRFALLFAPPLHCAGLARLTFCRSEIATASDSSPYCSQLRPLLAFHSMKPRISRNGCQKAEPIADPTSSA